VLHASGEAEALCGALCELGFADGVVSDDGDSLVHGAEVVLKAMRIDINKPSSCSASVVQLRDVRRSLGIRSGGREALAAIATLCGCDYDVSGTSKVGARKAFSLVRHLLRERSYTKSDAGFLQDLLDEITSEPSEQMLKLTSCAGCRRCKHGTGTKKAHSKAGCKECGTDQGCIERSVHEGCTCAFHRRVGERLLAYVQKANAGKESSAGRAFMRASDDARKDAKNEVSCRTQLNPKRPDLYALTDVLRRAGLGWSQQTVESKVLPVLLQHDLCNQHSSNAYFSAVGILKERALKHEQPWQYLVEAAPREYFESDRDRLDMRSVRKAVMELHWPKLVDRFKREQRANTRGKQADVTNVKSIKEAFSAVKSTSRGEQPAHEAQERDDEQRQRQERHLSATKDAEISREDNDDDGDVNAIVFNDQAESGFDADAERQERGKSADAANEDQASTSAERRESSGSHDVIDLTTPDEKHVIDLISPEERQTQAHRHDSSEHLEGASQLRAFSPRKRQSPSTTEQRETKSESPIKSNRRSSTTASAQRSITDFY
jgi:hypothetical protein